MALGVERFRVGALLADPLERDLAVELATSRTIRLRTVENLEVEEEEASE